MKTGAPGRALLLSVAPEQIRRELFHDASASGTEAGPAKVWDFKKATDTIERLRATRELTESDVLDFAKAGRFAEAVVGLAMLTAIPPSIIKPLATSEREDGLLTVCRAADLNWQTLHTILQTKSSPGIDFEILEKDYARMSKTHAQRVLQRWRERLM